MGLCGEYRIRTEAAFPIPIGTRIPTRRDSMAGSCSPANGKRLRAMLHLAVLALILRFGGVLSRAMHLTQVVKIAGRLCRVSNFGVKSTTASFLLKKDENAHAVMRPLLEASRAIYLSQVHSPRQSTAPGLSSSRIHPAG